MRVRLDSGLPGGKPQSALARNALMPGAGLADVDAEVISYLQVTGCG